MFRGSAVLATLVAAHLIVAPLSVSAALVVDGFEDGAFSITDTDGGGGASAIQDGLSHSIGGRRTARATVRFNSDPGTATLDLTLTPSDDVVIFSITPGVSGNSTSAIGQLTFTGDPVGTTYDLSSTDRILVRLTNAPSIGTLSLKMETGSDGALIASMNIAGAGLYEFVYSDYLAAGSTFDLSNIAQTEIGISAIANSSALTYAISEVYATNATAVPEPNGSILFAVGPICIALSRVRLARCNRHK